MSRGDRNLGVAFQTHPESGLVSRGSKGLCSPLESDGYVLEPTANTGLRQAFHDHARRFGWTVYIPKFGYTTDNAAMIAMVGCFKYQDKDFCSMDKPAYSRVEI